MLKCEAEDNCSQPLRVEDNDWVPDWFRSDDLEDGHLYRAYRSAELEGFDCRCLMVYRGSSLVLVAPYFVMDFKLNTMLPDGWLKLALAWLRLKVVCVGNPVSESGQFEGKPTTELLEVVNEVLKSKADLIAYKGFGPDLPLKGFVRVESLPIAILDLKPSYWADLSAERRKNLRRKLRAGRDLTVTEVDNIGPELIPALFAMYEATYERAKVKFEKLTPRYFEETAPWSRYLLFYERERLIGFVQTFRKNKTMGLYYGGMDYERSQHYGLYFLFFLTAIEIALREGCSEVWCGLTSYQFKQFLGCRLRQTFIYYRHSNSVVNWALSRLAFLLKPSDEELR